MRGDPQLPSLDLAWSPSRVAELFARRVLPALNSRQEVAALSLKTETYTPGRECVVLCSLRFVDSEAAPVFALATFSGDEYIESIHARHYEAGVAVANGLSGRGVLLPEYGCLVEFFPADWKLPSLPRAADGVVMAPLLTRHLADLRSRPQADVRVLRYRPHKRCLLLYAAKGAAGRREVIGKVYKQAPRAAEAAGRQRILRNETADSGLVIPEPLAVLPALNLLLMERLPGRPMNDVLRVGPRDGQEQFLARRAAVALSILHSLRPGHGEVHSLADELGRIRRRVDELQLVAPVLVARMTALLDRIASEADRNGSPRPSLLHGDFKPSQLLVDRGHLAVLDLDRAWLGDPALDVGNFKAQCRKEAILTGRDALRGLARPFLDEYGRRAPTDGLALRARLFETLALIRMADRRFRLDPPSYAVSPAASLPVRLLNEAADCLAGGGP
jgi:hypothetical protein